MDSNACSLHKASHHSANSHSLTHNRYANSITKVLTPTDNRTLTYLYHVTLALTSFHKTI